MRFFGTLSLPVVCHPAPIHQHNRMGLSGDVAADLVEMHLHGLRVRPRQHERRPLAVSRTDGAEQIGVAIALIGRLAGARALSCPQARQAILWPRRASSWNQISTGVPAGRSAICTWSVSVKFF